ncbi:MAG: CBS domain-containing protein [Pyrinomonadaceae bacterium]
MNCPSCGHENIDGNDRCENCLAPFRDLDVPRADSAEGLARSVMEDNLSELDTDETICVPPDTPALEVARLMKNSNSGCALVVDGGKLVGIFTEHDVLLRMTGQAHPGSPAGAATTRPDKPQFVEPRIIEHPGPPRGQAAWGGRTPDTPNEAAVKHLMTANPEVLRETDSVAEALNKMSLGRYRHIPYVKSDGSYGVASIKSVLKYIAQEDW